MNLIWHFISSGILAILIFPFFGWQVLWILIGGFFIDVDHYFLYIVRLKRFNLIEAYRYVKEKCEKKEFKDTLCIFHTIEFIILLAILSFYFKFIFLILIGLILHMILDSAYLINHKERRARAFSFFMWLKHYYSKNNVKLFNSTFDFF